MKRATLALALLFAGVVAGCAQIGPDAASEGGEDGGRPSCGHVKVRAPRWGATCQRWIDDNCCYEQSVCASDPGCGQLALCINGCIQQQPDTCVASCKGKALSASIERYEAVGHCSGSISDREGDATLPVGCEWP